MKGITHSLERNNHSKLKPYKKAATYKDYKHSKSSKLKPHKYTLSLSEKQ